MFQEETRETAPAHHMTSPRGTGAGPNGKRKWPTGVQALGPHGPGRPRQIPWEKVPGHCAPKASTTMPRSGDGRLWRREKGRKGSRWACVMWGAHAQRTPHARPRRPHHPCAIARPWRSALPAPLCQNIPHCMHYCRGAAPFLLLGGMRGSRTRLGAVRAQCTMCSAQCAGGRSVSVAPRGANWPGVHSQPLLSVLYSPPWSRTQPQKAHITGIICTTA